MLGLPRLDPKLQTPTVLNSILRLCTHQTTTLVMMLCPSKQRKQIFFPRQSYVRSGYVQPERETLWFASIYAFSWSLTTNLDNARAYLLSIGNQLIDSSGHDKRYIAFPVLILCAERENRDDQGWFMVCRY